jgi:hypothetical protein
MGWLRRQLGGLAVDRRSGALLEFAAAAFQAGELLSGGPPAAESAKAMTSA